MIALTVLSSLVVLQSPTTPAPAQPTLKMPAQIQAQPGQIFVVKAESNLKWRRWTIPAGLTRVPPEDTKYGDDAFVGYGPAGVYEFKLEGTVNDQYADGKTVVFVGQPAPNPKPGPTPPPPADPLASELQALFSKEQGREKRDKLISLWQSAIPQVLENPEYATLRQFAEAMSVTGTKFPFNLVKEDLHSIRQRLAEELATTCGGASAALGLPKSECRTRAAVLLERYAAALSHCQ